MVAFDSGVLGRLQAAARRNPYLHDPVFCLDESLGSISAIFQIDDSAASTAAVRGSDLLVELLRKAGIPAGPDSLERINTELHLEGTT